MMVFLKKMLAARAVAAAFGVATSTAALLMLPSKSYGVASLAVSTSAVATVALFLPFSKYVLVSRNSTGVARLFWKLQPIVALVVALGCAIWVGITNATASLAFVSGLFAISQGWKEFGGELLRVRRNARGIGHLYILDAATTLLLALLTIYVTRSAEMWIASSAVSSLFWSYRLTRREASDGDDIEPISVYQIYRYSIGVVGSGTLNAAAVSAARAAVLKITPVEMVGALQFTLDMLQKSMALFSSSITSAAVPEGGRNGADSVLKDLVFLMALGAAFLLTGALALRFVQTTFEVSGAVGMTMSAAVGCALLVWANRFKSTFCDLPLMCLPKETYYLLLGSCVSLSIAAVVAREADSIEEALIGSAAAFILGGTVSVSVALVRRLCGTRYLLSAVIMAIAFFGSGAICIAVD